MFDTRRVVICGGLICTTGFVLSAYATSVEFLYFSYGFLVGVGGSLAYSPSIVAVSQHFVKKRAFAVGVCFAGSGVGAFVLPPVVRLALTCYGLDGTFLIMAGIFFNLCVCGMLYRPATFYLTRHRLKRTRQFGAKCSDCRRRDCVTVSVINIDVPKTELALRSSKIITTANVFRNTKKAVFDWQLLRNPLLYLYAVSLSVANSSFSNIFNILPQHTQQLGVSKTDAVWIVSIVGFADLGSRLCIGGFADLNLFRKRHIFQFSIFGCGLAFCVAPLITSYPLLAADCAVMSFAAGSFVTLAPVLLTEGLGAENLSTAYGFSNMCDALPYLFAPPLVSSLRDATGSWNGSFVLCGMFLIMAAMFNVLGPFCCTTARKQLQLADSNVSFARDRPKNVLVDCQMT
ncbi:Monocarboxylate transporter 12 [Lamellibrachia satsuma]|nr:Monocarboxylate transporter 12 [Lamellibrachia satsuma]